MKAFQSFVDVISNATFTVSSVELSLLMIILSTCLVLRFSRTGLIASYLFCYKTGWVVMANHSQSYMIGYMVFGVLVGVATVVGMLKSDQHD